VVVSPQALLEEIDMLEGRGVPVAERLGISESCPLILPYHVALDQARERARGSNAIGTTGRGIGPAYEDKVSRRGIRLGELLDAEHFTERLREVMDYHNFALRHYFAYETVDYHRVLHEALAQAERIRPLVEDVTGTLHGMRAEGRNIMFEGAQGALLDIDHGTYPFVTSSNTTAGGAATGTGVGPRDLDYVLGIVKAYTTRVGAGPFPTELFDDDGDHLGVKGHEFGATTGRKRRCGWLDTVALRRSLEINSVSGMCITKLDVLDGLETLKICVAYRIDGRELDAPPVGADLLERCEPVLIELPGWRESTVGTLSFDALPENARGYLRKVEELCAIPIDIISTGPDRDETLVLRHPFE
jgi:adenylosuccinate synthase